MTVPQSIQHHPRRLCTPASHRCNDVLPSNRGGVANQSSQLRYLLTQHRQTIPGHRHDQRRVLTIQSLAILLLRNLLHPAKQLRSLQLATLNVQPVLLHQLEQSLRLLPRLHIQNQQRTLRRLSHILLQRARFSETNGSASSISNTRRSPNIDTVRRSVITVFSSA